MGPTAFKSQRARGSVLNHSLLREVVCLNQPLVDRAGMRSKEGGGLGRGGGLLPVLKEEPFEAKTLARAAWPFTAQPPLSSWPTTADDKAPAANYPADGESLKWDCQSKGWPLCLQWDKSEGG